MTNLCRTFPGQRTGPGRYYRPALAMDKSCFRILVLYCLLALLYAFGVPLWEAPDEPSHYLCVRKISDGRSFRPPRPVAPPLEVWSEGYLYSLYESAQPPLYYRLAAPFATVAFSRALPLGASPGLPPVRPGFSREGNLFAHRRSSLLSLPPGEIRGHLLRLLSVAFGAAAIFFVYRLARLLAPSSPPVALLAAGFAATLPQFTFITAAIGNDALSVAVAAAALFFLLRSALAPSPSRADRLAAGFLLAAGLFVKANLLFLFPVALLSLFLSRPRPGPSGNALDLFLPSAVLIAFALIARPGDLLPRARLLWLRATALDPALLAPARLRLMAAELSASFVARFGWMSVPVGEWLVWCWAGALAASAAGWIASARRPRDRLHLPGSPLLLAAVLFLLLGAIKNNLFVPQHQGRYLFPALPALAVLFAAGFLNLFPPARRSRAAAVLVATLAALNLAAFFGYLVPASYPG